VKMTGNTTVDHLYLIDR